VEETNTFLKTYTHRCEGSLTGALAINLPVIAGMGKSFGNEEAMKSRNRDWE
jgi:hypothetical protein